MKVAKRSVRSDRVKSGHVLRSQSDQEVRRGEARSDQVKSGGEAMSGQVRSSPSKLSEMNQMLTNYTFPSS